MDLEKLKYPIGTFKKPVVFGKKQVTEPVLYTSTFPMGLRNEVIHLKDNQLDTPYRPDGWSIRQVVHHLADSHMNALIRFKLTLTEDKPTIKPYFEDRWAKLSDSSMPIDSSLSILVGVHARMAQLWGVMTESDLQRCYIHPEYKKEFSIGEAMALYDWHARHHLAHITSLKERKGW